MPLPKNQRGVYGDTRADFERAKGALAGFTGLGDEPSVMDTEARDIYSKSELSSILSNMIPGKGALSGGLGALGSLKNLRRITNEQATLDDLRDLFYKYTKSRGEGTWDQKHIAGELLRNIEDDPLASTHMFTDDTGLSAKAAYQLSPREQGTYLPYLVSFEKGLGTEALEDAYQQAKKSWPDKPVYLYSTPHAEDFYERQVSRGWDKSLEDGVPRYERKAKGGLIQISECSCQHKAEGGEVEPSHSDLYQQRERGDQSVAPQEHRAFAREWVRENPALATPSLLAAIPGYYAAKKLGLIKSRTPASLEQVREGYKGVGEGLQSRLSSVLDKLRQDGP